MANSTHHGGHGDFIIIDICRFYCGCVMRSLKCKSRTRSHRTNREVVVGNSETGTELSRESQNLDKYQNDKYDK